ncbi:YebC/PmpR family DNA-binding transcriptional regulator [bacterium]|nr:YebC/PmpR family DNA-binding transcriptional regulator [bacterium]
MGAQWKAKHRAEAANAKGRLFGKLSKEISIAARSGNDPDMNPKLRLLVDQAKKASMPRETLERALKKHTDKDAVNYEATTYEGFTPHRVAVIVECLTDNVNRTASEMRLLFRKGQLGTSGSVSWDFDRVGMIEAQGSGDPEEAAIEAGAQDFEAGEDGSTMFYTEPGDLDLVCKALPDSKYTVISAKLGWRAKNPVRLGEAELAEVEAFLAAIDNNDDVQDIYAAL